MPILAIGQSNNDYDYKQTHKCSRSLHCTDSYNMMDPMGSWRALAVGWTGRGVLLASAGLDGGVLLTLAGLDFVVSTLFGLDCLAIVGR